MSDPLTIKDLRVDRGEFVREGGDGPLRPIATALTPAEFADIARREGWVKLDDPQVTAEWTITNEVDEADLRSQGWVKSPDLDLDALRDAVRLHRDRGYVILEVSPPLRTLVECAEAVLTALDDQEDRA
jgi:hypothetical protein